MTIFVIGLAIAAIAAVAWLAWTLQPILIVWNQLEEDRNTPP